MKEGWKEVTLGELFIIERGGSPRPIQAFLTNAEDGINWIKIGDTKNSTKYITETKEKIIPDGVRRSRMVYEGDFLLSNSMSFGRPYIMKTSGCIHDGWLVLREKTKFTDKDFFYYLLGSDVIFKQFDNLAAGSTVRNLNIALVSKVSVPLPPLDEQQRIVQKLDAAFAAIDQAIANTEKNLEQPENLFQVIIDQSYDEISGAEKNILDSICELIVDCEHKTAPTELSGYPSIRTTNIGKGKINFDNVNYVSYDSYIQWTRRAVPQPDDLILAREAPAGNVAIIPEGYKVCLGQRTVLLRPKKDVISSKYLMYNLLSSKIRERLLAHSKGATVTHVNVKDIRNLDIGSIPEFDQQKNIINKIEEVDRITTKLIENYQTKIENLQELKQSILQKAFQGELT